MNTYFEQAKNFVDEEVGSEFGIVKESIQDLPDFYCFTYQSRKYLRTENFEDIVVGQGYNFIDKSNNRVYSYGSGYGFDEALKELKEKLELEKEIKITIPEFDRRKRFDLKITKVLNKQILVDALLKHRLTYIVPEIVGESIFRIEKNYKKKLLSEKISKTPILFHGINQEQLPGLLIEFIKNKPCQFKIIEQVEKTYAKYTDKATEFDLEPIW